MDLFDRIYIKWATVALNKHMEAPSRERWDQIVLLLLDSKDPDRVRRYHRLEANGPEGLGSDAYELWEQVPSYMSSRAQGVKTEPQLNAYAEAHQAAMRTLMERRGLLDRYNTIIAEQEQIEQERLARARRSQTTIVIMGCAGMGLILIMMLTVFIIIALKLTS